MRSLTQDMSQKIPVVQMAAVDKNQQEIELKMEQERKKDRLAGLNCMGHPKRNVLQSSIERKARGRAQ